MKSFQIRGFFWSVFSCIRTEYGRKSPYSVQIQENTDQKNSVFGDFSRSEIVSHCPLNRVSYSYNQIAYYSHETFLDLLRVPYHESGSYLIISYCIFYPEIISYYIYMHGRSATISNEFLCTWKFRT